MEGIWNVFYYIFNLLNGIIFQTIDYLKKMFETILPRRQERILSALPFVDKFYKIKIKNTDEVYDHIEMQMC